MTAERSVSGCTASLDIAVEARFGGSDEVGRSPARKGRVCARRAHSSELDRNMSTKSVVEPSGVSLWSSYGRRGDSVTDGGIVRRRCTPSLRSAVSRAAMIWCRSEMADRRSGDGSVQLKRPLSVRAARPGPSGRRGPRRRAWLRRRRPSEDLVDEHGAGDDDVGALRIERRQRLRSASGSAARRSRRAATSAAAIAAPCTRRRRRARRRGRARRASSPCRPRRRACAGRPGRTAPLASAARDVGAHGLELAARRRIAADVALGQAHAADVEADRARDRRAAGRADDDLGAAAADVEDTRAPLARGRARAARRANVSSASSSPRDHARRRRRGARAARSTNASPPRASRIALVPTDVDALDARARGSRPRSARGTRACARPPRARARASRRRPGRGA